ncbi:hypothetical protein PTT_09998 [Pyrenophora teres f. teres 0-1]|uniref:Uncharacterized protein n=1 Tax=Pyrenophora teres f. teres (strain 0-1) TaxID=861557 RepID=E3RN68_PYRTT|nr:hypothetical protein PTT_09998 [Pyrenophora teres f. teres 0-1]
MSSPEDPTTYIDVDHEATMPPPSSLDIQPDNKDHADGKEEHIWRFGEKAMTYKKWLEKQKDLDDAFLIWKQTEDGRAPP